MRRLGAPLRLTWDWDRPRIAFPGASPRRPSPELARAVGAEVVRSRVLMLEVGYPDPEALRSGELAAALEGFAGSLTLVLTPAAAAATAGLDLRQACGAEEVWVDATTAPDESAAMLRGLTGVRYYLAAGNVEAVGAGIGLALASGVPAISLPNLPLFGELLREAEAASPSLVQLEALAARIAGVLAGRAPVDLRVHHYALFQALRAAGVRPQGEDAPGAGCQAGAALAYVDPAGVLYPCASLPVPLARLGEGPGAIAAAWAGAELAALREGIARLPGRCRACPCEPTCRGGCRGWAHYLAGTWDATGPDCVRP